MGRKSKQQTTQKEVNDFFGDIIPPAENPPENIEIKENKSPEIKNMYQLKHVVIVSSSFIEAVTKKVGIQSDGYAMAVKSQEREIQMILQEFAYDRAEKLSVMSSPALRLGMLMSSTLLLVDSANKGKNMGSQPVTENVADKFKDI